MFSPSAARTKAHLVISLIRRLGAERVLHWMFEASLVIKGLLCSAEFAAGLGLLFTPNQLVARLVFWLTHLEISERPTDSLASWTRRAVEQFPVGTKHFYGWYLLAHGGLKLIMVIMLWARVLRAYPVAMFVLGGFVAYQLSEFAQTGSPFLLLLSFFDLVMIVLIGHEYRVMKSRVADGPTPPVHSS